MRRLIAVLSTLTLGATLALAGPAAGTVTAPANNATVNGTITLSTDGGNDGNPFYCGDDALGTTLELLNASNQVVFSQNFNGGGARSASVDTHDYPNGTYRVRAIDRNTIGTGLFNLGCGSNTDTNTRTITIRNEATTTYTGPTSAAATASVTVSAKVTDEFTPSLNLAGKTVSFQLSGGATVNGTTNGNGVATATLPISGPPRSATVTANFAGDAFFVGDSDAQSFTVTKQSTKTTVTPPADVVFGQATQFTAMVDVTEGTGTPTGGTVQFVIDGDDFGPPVPITGGSATSASTTSLSAGAHDVRAVYSGSAGYLGSTSAVVTQQVDKAATTTSLTQDVNPTVVGQTVTFSATVGVVAPGAGTPTGNVQFTIDGQPVGTAVPLDGDEATLAVASLDAGNHDVRATYNGDASFASSDSATIVQGVDQAETEVELSSSDASAVTGQPLTFTAEVSPTAPGAGDPGGTVTFFADGEQIGAPVPVDGGSATSDSVGLSAGTHEITATYSGDGNFAGSSASIDQAVAAAATTTSVTSSPNPSVFGQPVTVRAEVDPVSPATGSPVGAIKFDVDGGADIIFVELENGAAETTITGLSVGDHTIVATYLSADPNFVTSTSSPQTQTVNKAATETTVTSSSPTSVFGQPVTFTATVDVVAPGAGSPSGSITFLDGTEVIGTAAVSSSTGGQASIQVSDLSVAQHAITARYSGDGSFLSSDGSVNQKVERAQTSTLVTSSANPAQSGQAVTFTATVSPVAPGAGDPTGTVTFTINGAPLGNPVMVSGGTATSTAFATLSPGTYEIEATYSGNGNFRGSSGGLDQGTGLDVTKGATTMTLESSANPAAFAAPVTFTATVTAVAPAAGRPSGVVQFWEGGTLLGASNLAAADGASSASAAFVTSTLSPGVHPIRAVYVGNFNFEGQTATVSQDIGSSTTVTGITSSPNPSTFGDDVTLTATVAGAPGSVGSPSGVVTFRDGSTVLGTADLEDDDGVQRATLVVSGLSGGDHPLTATYSGSESFASSTSPVHTQHVNRAESTVEALGVITEIGDNGGTFRATLTGHDGEGIEGEPLVFRTTQQIGTATNLICVGVTDEDGYAECHNTNLVPGTLVNGSFDVTFEGNADHLPSTDSGTYFGD